MDDKVFVIGDDNPKNPANTTKTIVRLNVPDFDPAIKHPHCMFSSWPVDRIWEGINETINSHGRTKIISESKLRVSFEAKIEKQAEQQAAADGAPAEEELEDQCFVQVDILKVPGQDKHCVNFTRRAGSTVYYYDVI